MRGTFKMLAGGLDLIMGAPTDQARQMKTVPTLQVKSGETMPADIIVTATGLQLQPVGGLSLSVDGKPVEMPKTMSYKGMMYSDVPNLASAVGYTNASWTLKCDLTCEYVCRILNLMRRKGYRMATPRIDPSVKPEPWVDFTSGYVQRAAAHMPKQGDKRPWRLYQNYALDILSLHFGRLQDGVMEFRS